MSTIELASWVFGIFCLLYLAVIATYLVVRNPEHQLPPVASFILGIFCGTAVGFCTYFFSGEFGLTFDLPGMGISGNAASSVGVFVLVLLLWRGNERAAARERDRIR